MDSSRPRDVVAAWATMQLAGYEPAGGAVPELRCQMCGTVNPPEAATCSRCEAALTAHGSAHPQAAGAPGSAELWPMVTTCNEFVGYRVVRYLGIVRGLTVRSRSIVGGIGASLQQIVGGNISLYTELCEEARDEAYNLMVQHTLEKGANAVLGMHYDANEVAEGATEVLCYGTAVIIEPLPAGTE